MKLKKFALRGLIVLAVAVALCMFFARTVQTITTPKVQLVTATNGRFEETMSFQAEVYFEKTEEIILEGAKNLNVKVKRIYVKPGHYVKEGETIFTTEAPSYEEDLKKLQEDYAAKAKELVDLDITNRKLSKESQQNQLYNELLDAQDALSEATYEGRFVALENGITLSGDVTSWKQQLALIKDVPKEVTTAVDKAVAARATFDAATSAYLAILENKKLRVSDEVFKYINDRNTLMDAMDELTEQMVELNVTMSSLQTVTAPRDGYIVSIAVNEGDTYDGLTAAFVMNEEETQPVLRAPLSDTTRTIADDTKAEVVSDVYGTEKTTVQKTMTAADGNKYLYIAMPESMLGENSSAIRRFISDGSVAVNITYRAKESTTLLTPSAVRTDGTNSYVWVIQNNWGGFMSASSMKVVKTNVTVIERSDKAVSISENLAYQQIADREDRALKDGQTVMEYVQ